MAGTLGTMRELPAYSEYTRFGPSYRQSPESITGSRFSSSSNSRSKGCWCSYPWMFLLLILIIISLIISNLSIYFLMKDSCDANMAKLERDIISDRTNAEGFPILSKSQNDMMDKYDLRQYFTTPFAPPPSFTRLFEQQNAANSPYPKTMKVVDYNNDEQSTKRAPYVISPPPVERIPPRTTTPAGIRPDVFRAPNTGAAVAGILELEATIRIPHEMEGSQVPSSSSPIAEEYFDLARYFSMKSQSHNDIRNRRTTWTDNAKDNSKPVSTNTALVGQSAVFENDEDNSADTVFQPETFMTTLATIEYDASLGNSWLHPFYPLSESNRIDENAETKIDEPETQAFTSTDSRTETRTLSTSIFPTKIPQHEDSVESTLITVTQTSSIETTHSNVSSRNDLSDETEHGHSENTYDYGINHSKSTNVPVPEEYMTLPETLLPTSYIVEWHPHLEPGSNQFTFDGFVLINFYCVNTTDELLLNAKDLTIDQRSMAVIEKNNFTNVFPISSVQINEYNSLMLFTLTKPLQQGFNYSFGTRFMGNMSYNSGGLNYIDYRDSDGVTKYLAATQFEVAEARRAFPCFDEPRFKANFTITIIRNKNMISLSNMKLVQSVPRSDDYVEDHYATSVKMSTYLVAFVVCDFQYKQAQSKRGVTIRTFSRPDFINDTSHALNTAVKLLDYFEDYFDILYPLEKLDLIALPDFSHGAMENWGLITFKETTMLFDPKTSLAQQRESVSMIVGHELAHQWFGNLVTMRWWNDLWLNEGFAHYMGFASAEAIYPEEPMEHVYILSNALDALKLDSMASTHPVLFDVLHPLEIVQLFDTITYKKGSCLVRMMAHFLGPDTLRMGLQIYLRDNAYKNTISDDLWLALDKAVIYNPTTKRRMEGLSVTTVMDNWIRLTGHPIVTVTRNYSKGTAIITQERMKQSPDTNFENRTKNDQLWVIPFTYLTSENLLWDAPKFTWLQNDTTVIYNLPSALSWFVGNVNFQGFYRVNYDETNWQLLFEQLKLNHLAFTEAQRAQILADSFDFSSSGILDITLALNATEYLSSETEFLPWLVALKNFHYVDIMMQTTNDYELFKEFMRNLLRPLYEKLGWKQQTNDNKHTIYLRYAVLEQSCHFENRQCLDKTSYLLQSWMQRKTLDNISVELKPLVKCYGLAQGGSQEMQFVVRELKDVKASMCSRDQTILENILLSGLNDSFVRIWHLPELVRAASTTYLGRRVGRSFVVTNWRNLTKTLNEVAGDFAYVFQQSSDSEDIIQLLSLLAAEDVNVAWRKLEEAKEALNANMMWKQKYLKKIVHWLNKVVKHQTDNTFRKQ